MNKSSARSQDKKINIEKSIVLLYTSNVEIDTESLQLQLQHNIYNCSENENYNFSKTYIELVY